MYYSVHVKNVFDWAKKTKNVISLNYKDNDFTACKKCVLVDFIEHNDEHTFELKVDLFLKDLSNENEEKMLKLDVAQVQNFIVTGNSIDVV